MSFLNFKNIPVSLNGNSFVVDEVQLSNEIQLSPTYKVGDPTAEEVVPNAMWIGELKISYYLTGYDYLKQYIYSNKDESITGNIGSLQFNQGYLSNYSINIEPNNPVKVSATLSFYDQLTGIFSPSSATANSGFIFRSSDISINNLNTYTVNKINNFSRASFTYECQLTPSYNFFDTGTMTPTRADNVFIGERTITTEITSDNTNLTLGLTGEKFGAFFTFYNPFNTGLYETFGCSGKINSKSLNINTSTPHNQTIRITQNHVNKAGYITSVPTGINNLTINFNIGSFPLLSRDGSISYVDSIYIGDTQLTGYSINRTPDFDQIISPIPFTVLNDILTVNTSYGNYVWPNKVLFNYPQITITGLSANTGSAGNVLTISGTNFIRVSDVIFGNNAYSLFQTIDPQTIVATIPNNGQTAPINVSSFYRNTSGLTNTFYYEPIITGLSPVTGVWKDSINIIGSNFSGVTGVFFNQTPAFSYSIINNNLIIAQTPETGQPFPSGYINVNGTGGYGQSISVYNPTIPIYSFSPTSGVPTTRITIYTKIDTGYYSSFSGGYKVRLGGIDTPFFISGGNSTGALTGALQNTSEEDYIYIYKPDGISTSSSQNKFTVAGFPNLTAISPSVVNRYQNTPLTLFGENLSFFFGNNSFISITGGISGDSQFYNKGDFVSSLDGSTLIIGNLRPTGNTGFYDVSVTNSVSGDTLYQALQINSPVNQASNLTPTYSLNGNLVIAFPGHSLFIPQVNPLFTIDSSYDTFGAIAHPTSSHDDTCYVSFVPDSATTINIQNIRVNFVSNADVLSLQGQKVPPLSLTPNYSGSIVCFSKNSTVAFSGAHRSLSGVSIFPSSSGLTGINEIRIIAANAPLETYLPITELEVY